jgi:hypothetical protein
MNDTLYQLVNPPITFKFAGKEYQVKKANLEKALLYQRRLKELNEQKATSPELRLSAYAIFIVLKDVDPEITEDFVLQNTPADIDVLECLTMLGFMSPQQMERARKVEESITKKLTLD